jgi:D-3-phosphoglycerate dehydrogenase
VCTPHIGYVEQDSYELYFNAAFDNVVNFIQGTPTNIVNPEALRIGR